MSVASLGRELSLFGGVNNTGLNVAAVAPGSSVDLRVVGSWESDGSDCPFCITQFYARMNDVVSLCLGSTIDGASFDKTATFTARPPNPVFITSTQRPVGCIHAILPVPTLFTGRGLGWVAVCRPIPWGF